MRRLASQFIGMRFSIVATVAVCLLAAASQVRLCFVFFSTTLKGESEMDTTLFSFALCPCEQRRTKKPPDIPDIIPPATVKLLSD
jgi:hypothetical protein